MFTKKNYLRYLSHLDLVRLFHRSFNRSQIPIKYSEGFNPHPKFSIANPLSLGIESEGEYIDIELTKDMLVEDFMSIMNSSLPQDIQIIKAVSIEKGESISAIIDWAFYEIKFWANKKNIEVISQSIDSWLKQEAIMITKLKKKGKNKVPTEVNIIPLIGNVIVKGKDENDYIIINALLKTGEKGNLKPIEFMEALNKDTEIEIDIDSIIIKRLSLYAEENGNIYSPL